MIDAIRSRDNRLSNVIVALQGKDFKMLMKCMRRPRLLQTSSAITQQFYDDVSEDRNVFKAKLLHLLATMQSMLAAPINNNRVALKTDAAALIKGIQIVQESVNKVDVESDLDNDDEDTVMDEDPDLT
jgi:hypothetical protein